MIKKREIFCLFFLLLLLIPAVSAVSFDMKANYSQGETIITKISGNFLQPVLKDNVYFYRDVYTRVPMDYDIAKLGDDYYLYAALSDKAPGSYSVVIKNVQHTEFTNTTSADITQNFTITSDKVDFFLDTGFISTKADFSVKATNLKDSSITIDISLINGTLSQNQTSLTVSSGQTKDAVFSIDSFNQGINIIEFSDANIKYRFPVFNSVASSSGGIVTPQEVGFAFEPNSMNISLKTGQASSRTIYLTNTGKETLNNIALSVSNSLKPFITLSADSIPVLEVNSTAQIQISISSQANQQYASGNILANLDSLSLVAYSELDLNYLDNYVPTAADNQSQLVATCTLVNGIKMDASCTNCNGYTVISVEGRCCVGECAKGGGGSAGTVVVIILLVLVLGGVVFYLLRKAKKGAKGKLPESRSGSLLSGVDLLKMQEKKFP